MFILTKKKGFLGFLLALSVLSSIVSVANAEGIEAETKATAPAGVKILTPDEYENYLSSLTIDEWAKINEKIQSSEEVARYSVAAVAGKATATKIGVPGTFNMYQQTQSNYCVPAVAKSMVQYLTGSSDSQGTIAAALQTSFIGTDSTKLPPYLNSKQSKIYYIYSQSPSQTTLLNNLYYDIVINKSPGSTVIYNPSGANWHYPTSAGGGHQLVVNAIYDDKSIIQFADPLGGTESGWPYYYEKTAAVASSVVSAVIW